MNNVDLTLIEIDPLIDPLEMKPGTTESLRGIGVRDSSKVVKLKHPDLPQVKKGWTSEKVLFKGEKGQVNIELGKGKGLENFNENIVSYEVIRK